MFLSGACAGGRGDVLLVRQIPKPWLFQVSRAGSHPPQSGSLWDATVTVTQSLCIWTCVSCFAQFLLLLGQDVSFLMKLHLVPLLHTHAGVALLFFMCSSGIDFPSQ